jgi:hypothetical protein
MASPARALRRTFAAQQRNIDQSKGPRMIIDISGPVTDVRGTTAQRATGVFETVNGQERPVLADMTFADLLIDAVADKNGEELPPKTKIAIVRLQLLFASNDKVTLTDEDVVFIKQRAEKLPSLGYCRVLELFPGSDESGPADADDDAPEPMIDAALHGIPPE